VTKGRHIGIDCDGDVKNVTVSMKTAIMNVCGTDKRHKESPDEFFLVRCMW
jgi:phosphoribosyl-AMP cyclohydrolase